MQYTRSVVVVATTVAASMSAYAQQPAVQLPTPQQVYTRYAEAIGGRDAWSKVQGRTEHGTADITFAGMSGSYVRHVGAPNKMRMSIGLGVARIDKGFDGRRGWIVEPASGGPTRLPQQEEADLAEALQVGDAFLRPAALGKVAVEGKATFDGIECYRVSVTTKAGRERHEFFEVESGLRRGTVSRLADGMQQVTYNDYRDFDGKKLASRIVQSTVNGDVVITIARVSFAAPDSTLFVLPDALR